jgi:hypothetical protein
VTTLEERRQQGARAQQLARRIMKRTPGLDEPSAIAAAKIHLGMDKPSFDVKTRDCGHWEGRYFVMDLPTGQMSKEWRDPRSGRRA